MEITFARNRAAVERKLVENRLNTQTIVVEKLPIVSLYVLLENDKSSVLESAELITEAVIQASSPTMAETKQLVLFARNRAAIERKLVENRLNTQTIVVEKLPIVSLYVLLENDKSSVLESAELITEAVIQASSPTMAETKQLVLVV
ncbi:hypothetical protein L2E82_14700 [Cichorium intybus]|uniref:Uncharacterized protein n=1 Tax=Cichorium intybus TaxID=13427 RepID=A0ACB9F0R4_CICIN|nr:hypothetical protein L2E82_14700 [Cichorium intybus]